MIDGTEENFTFSCYVSLFLPFSQWSPRIYPFTCKSLFSYLTIVFGRNRHYQFLVICIQYFACKSIISFLTPLLRRKQTINNIQLFTFRCIPINVGFSSFFSKISICEKNQTSTVFSYLYSAVYL